MRISYCGDRQQSHIQCSSSSRRQEPSIPLRRRLVSSHLSAPVLGEDLALGRQEVKADPSFLSLPLAAEDDTRYHLRKLKDDDDVASRRTDWLAAYNDPFCGGGGSGGLSNVSIVCSPPPPPPPPHPPWTGARARARRQGLLPACSEAAQVEQW